MCKLKNLNYKVNLFGYNYLFCLKLVNLDLSVATRSTEPVEFRLVDGTGPVFITCMHVIEVADSGMMGDDMMGEDSDEDDEEEEEEEEVGKKGGKPQKNGAKSSGAAEGSKKRKRN